MAKAWRAEGIEQLSAATGSRACSPASTRAARRARACPTSTRSSPASASEPVSHEAPCTLCDYVAWERLDEERIVVEREGLVLLCPYAGRGPSECLVAPLEHEPDGFESPLLGAALDLAAEALRRLRSAEGPRPANLWLRQDGHWRLEIVPRLTVFASLELATGHFVNPLAPEDAAATLRGAAAA